jgi:putative FmdB family regulatory protein
VPIYEYRCPNGHTFEVFQRMSDPPVTTCEVCSAGPVEKVLYPVAVHFKGKGFYSTDYGRGSRAAKDGEGASAGKESSGGDNSAATGTEKTSTGSEGGSAGTKTDSS